MKTKNLTSNRSDDRHIVHLGRAKQLTKASFSGTQVELIPDRLYQRGG